MRRFSEDEIDEIRKLIGEGASLSNISSYLGRCKSAVQYHAAKFREKRAREKELLVENLTDKELGWLIGCYAGDGSRYLRRDAYSYEVKFALSENEYAIVKFVEAVLLKIGMKTRRSIEGKRVYVRCQSKQLYRFMERHLMWDGRKKSTSVRLANLSSYPNNFLFGFLCGLIDADGGTKRLYISTSSAKLADNILDICETLEIGTNKHEYDVFHIYLSKPDYIKACGKYGFSSIKHRISDDGPGRGSPSVSGPGGI